MTRDSSALNAFRFRAALALGFVALSIMGLTAACGTDTITKKPECEDGVINKDTGKCEGKCTPDKCVADNTCVNNRCVLKCSSILDCFHDGTQDCVPAVEDDTMTPITACLSNGKAYGVGFGCAFGSECNSFGACKNGGSCNPTLCGGQPDSCLKDPAACGDKADCTIGKCMGDGSACTVNPCPASECQSLFCVTKGEGDADAYCTVPGCAADTDCAAGYYCGYTRDPHQICGTSKGNSGLCGKTNEPCINAADLGNGNSLKEGAFCIERKTCLKRTQCTPCAADIDCSLVASQKCVDIGGAKACARSCNVNNDCDADSYCDSGFCKPQYGSCVGKAGFCEPCLNDEDCGGKDTTKACYDYNGGQRACVDLQGGTCTADTDCPKSMGNNLNGLCSSDGVCLPPLYQDELSCW